MRRLVPRFSVRTLLVLVGIVAGLMAVSLRARQIHQAIRYIELQGGDVWCEDVLYSGYGGPYPKRSASKLLRDRGATLGRLVLGGSTEIWVFCVPENREEFARQMRLVNPESISFDSLGTNDYAWATSVLPTVAIYPAPYEFDANFSDTNISDMSLADALEAASVVEALFAASHKHRYRLTRYNRLAGIESRGEMHRTRDTLTGRTYEVPWPRIP